MVISAALPCINLFKALYVNARFNGSSYSFLACSNGNGLNTPNWTGPKDRNEYDEPLKRAFTYKALNKLIQGSAADMTKKSMVALYENGIIPHIQIHDEVDISVESDAKAEEIISIMESAVELKVPNKVDYEKGNNWGDIK